MKVVIAGGGTAGHVMPGLALADALGEADVTFFGTDRGAEAALVPAAGRVLLKIRITGFDRGRPYTLVTSGGRALDAIRRARRDLALIGPDVVVGMGGYVSLPVCYAARSLRVPVVLHEQNIVLGLSHRACRRFARRIAVSFEETLLATGPKGLLTGNPVGRSLVGRDLAAAHRAGLERFDLDPSRKTLLVTGGSLGAARINEAAIGLAELWGARDDLQIVHVTGRMHHDSIASQVRDRHTALVYRVVDYVDDMAKAYSVADLAVCRGGATTVAELGVVGLPAIIVPYPYHRDRQQELHGRAFERAGGGRVLLDSDTTPETLAAMVSDLLDDPAKLATMADKARGFGHPDAAERLAQVVREQAA